MYSKKEKEPERETEKEREREREREKAENAMNGEFDYCSSSSRVAPATHFAFGCTHNRPKKKVCVYSTHMWKKERKE